MIHQQAKCWALGVVLKVSRLPLLYHACVGWAAILGCSRHFVKQFAHIGAFFAPVTSLGGVDWWLSCRSLLTASFKWLPFCPNSIGCSAL